MARSRRVRALVVALGLFAGSSAHAERLITTNAAREEIAAPRTRQPPRKPELRLAAPPAASGPAAAAPARSDLELLPMFQISDEAPPVAKRPSRARVKVKPMSRFTGTPRPHQYVPCDRRSENAGDDSITGLTLSFKH